MVHHPVILVPKLVVLAILVILLVILHGTLSAEQFRVALIACTVGFVIFVAVLWTVGYKLLSNPESRLSKAITLSAEARAEDGYVASSDEFATLMGFTGKATSALRPSGTALISGKRIAVITSGEFIAAGAVIEVTEARGSRVVVKSASGSGMSQEKAPRRIRIG